MKKRREILFLALLLAAIFIMIVYSASKDSFRVTGDKEIAMSFSQSQREYISKKDKLYLGVPENLEYLNHGFLSEYVKSLLKPSSLEVELVPENSRKVDGKLAIVDDKLRKKIDTLTFSAPIFQITGSMFINVGNKGPFGRELTGVAIEGEFSDEEKKTLSYDGKFISLREVKTITAAVDLAERENLDSILGDRTAITAQLKSKNLQSQYVDMNAGFYEDNVCIVVPKEEMDLYHIINQCVHDASQQVLMSRAQEHWFGIPASFVKEERYNDAAVLLVIVFAAVFCAFFFYYQSNKNLYNELTDRMNQLMSSKQEMQTTFNGVSYYMAELNPDGIILDINKAFLKYLNRQSMGRHISDLASNKLT